MLQQILNKNPPNLFYCYTKQLNNYRASLVFKKTKNKNGISSWKQDEIVKTADFITATSTNDRTERRT